MQCILLVCGTSVIFTAIHGSFVLNDSGEALYLSSYIESGDTKTARNLALVPQSEIPIESYAGYLTVNKQHNSNLFFWFFRATVNPDDAPVLLWLQGGPGCSSMTGAFLENGPYSVDPHGKLVPRKYSWHTNHNIIYIDNPVGTGFSFTDAPDGYATTSNAVAAELLIALQQFFLLFPDLQKNDFFICGESYAGKYTLALGHAIHHSMAMPKINLKGLTIGNGFIEPLYQFLYADYLYQLGLIDANTHRIFVVNEKRQTDCILNGNYEGAHEIFQYLIHSHADSIFFNLSGFDSYYNYLEPQATNHTPMTAFVRTPETRRAIHVGHNVFCNLENVNLPKFNLWSDVMVGYAHYLTELLSHYPVLIYNGQLDIISAYPMTENLLNHLNFDGADQFRRSPRQIWRVNNELAGYIKCGGNLTSALVRNAGHMVPADKPKWMLDLLLKFTHPKGLV